jgi:protein TonB
VLLVVVLLTSIVVQMPKVDVRLTPPAVRVPPKPEPRLGRPADDMREQWTFARQTEPDVQLPEPPTVTPGADVTLAPPDIAELPRDTPPTSVARVLRSEEPPYPAAARRLGEQGIVVVRVLVGADGHAQQVELAGPSGSTRLDEAALRSVRGWLFRPAEAGAAPIASWITLRVIFRLAG